MQNALIEPGKANVLLDGQFGSTGKGLFAGYIAEKTKIPITIAVTNAAPNAGHTYVRGDFKIVAKHLPMAGLINPNTFMYIDAGAVINPEILMKEIRTHNLTPSRLAIHPRAAMITPTDIESERRDGSATKQLASTMSGVGSAIARKAKREKESVIGEFEPLHPFMQIIDLNYALQQGDTVLIETPQGMDLCVNNGYEFPFCTSRQVSVPQSLADADIHPRYMGKTIMTLRTFPIRVGNVVEENQIKGFSGNFYPDQEEMSWDMVGVKPELTTVTKRERRIATFSLQQYAKSCRNALPDSVFMNFANYISRYELEGILAQCESIYRPRNWFFGYGPETKDVIHYDGTNLKKENEYAITGAA